MAPMLNNYNSHPLHLAACHHASAGSVQSTHTRTHARTHTHTHTPQVTLALLPDFEDGVSLVGPLT